MVACMQFALDDAGLEPSAVDYVNAHATGTEQGDIAEAEAIGKLFGTEIPVSSLKGHLGHTMAASGAIELAGCIGMLQQQRLIATRNLETIDPRCAGILHVRAQQGGDLKVILKNNFAMGGVNSTLVIKKELA